MTTTTHTVKQGECLSRIAAARGLAWREVWEHPDNEPLRKRRKDPNVLHPGDVVKLPASTGRPSVPLELDATTTVVLRRPGHEPFELRVLDADGAAVADADWTLTPAGGGAALTGRTDAEGVARGELPVEVEQATLEVRDLRFDLDVGHLNPLEETDDDGVSGAQARLHNLGYRTGPIDGIVGPRTQGALRAFQAAEGLEVTGALDEPTRTRLRARHGS